MTHSVIDVSHLQKRFGDRAAVDDLSFRVPRGSVYGFLGRNGAGKTTTIKILLGMLRPSSGEASVFGLRADDPEQSLSIRQRVGFVSEIKEFYPGMSAEQMIRFTRPFYPKWNRKLEEHLVQTFQLPLKQKVTKLSKGMRTQLAILLAVSRGAELLILDEPTDGLDPVLVEETLRLLMSLAADTGVTIFFSSHQLTEVEQIADHVLIIDQGKACLEAAMDDLRVKYRRVRMMFDREVPTAFAALAGPRGSEGRMLSLLLKENVEEVVDQARLHHACDIDVQPVTLKEIFLETVGGRR